MSTPSTTVTALVPMRAHSERVPGKNTRHLAGRPLYHWILEALSGSRHVGEIVINTDSPEIAADAQHAFDVTILERPERLRGDMVPIQPLIEYDLDHSAGDLYLQTHCTNPLLTTATIDRAVETFLDAPDHDSLFSVTPVQKRFYWPHGEAVNHDPDILLRTQDLPPMYEENSCIYVFPRSVFSERNHRLGHRPLLFEMDALEAVDIDEEHDFAIADALMQRRLAAAEDGT